MCIFDEFALAIFYVHVLTSVTGVIASVVVEVLLVIIGGRVGVIDIKLLIIVVGIV